MSKNIFMVQGKKLAIQEENTVLPDHTDLSVSYWFFVQPQNDTDLY